MKLYEKILKFFILKLLLVRLLSQEISEDIFYGEIPVNAEFQKLKDQVDSVNKNIITISNIKQYIDGNQTNFQNFDTLKIAKGNCTKLVSVFSSFYARKNYLKGNLNSLKSYLNEKNYLFNDQDGNIIAYSTCPNFIDTSCVPQFFIISKLYILFKF